MKHLRPAQQGGLGVEILGEQWEEALEWIHSFCARQFLVLQRLHWSKQKQKFNSGNVTEIKISFESEK